MKKYLVLILVWGLGLSACAAALSVQDSPKPAPSSLQGRWSAVQEFDADGKAHAIKEDDPRHFIMDFQGEKLITKLKKRSLEGEFTVDPAHEPPHINIVRQRNGKKQTFRGIFQVQGERLKFCLAGASNDRPTAFKAGEGIEFAVELQRVK